MVNLVSPGIEVTITNSTVTGDIITGNKTVKVDVHLHADKLSSASAILNALAESGQNAKLTDDLIQRVVGDHELWKRLEDCRYKVEENEVDTAVDDALKEMERLGPTDSVVSRLHELLNRSRKREQWMAYSKLGTLLLQVRFNSLDYHAQGSEIAEELIRQSISKHAPASSLPIAHAFQAAQYIFLYGKRIHDLKFSLEAYKLQPAKFPPVNLLSENKEILGYASLADFLIGKALEEAFSIGNADVIIIIASILTFIIFNLHYIVSVTLGRDASEIRDRLYRAYSLAESISQKLGTQRDKAVVDMNVANFYLVQCDFEKAEILSFNAAMELSKNGNAHEAQKALEIHQRARRRDKPFVDISQITMPDEISGDQFELMVKDFSSGLLRLQGFDPASDPQLSGPIDTAYKDINPQRVMIHCENIEVNYRPSPLGESVHLHSLGEKRIFCVKYSKGISTHDGLDYCFDIFKEQLGCETCPYRHPRASEWKWTVKFEN